MLLSVATLTACSSKDEGDTPSKPDEPTNTPTLVQCDAPQWTPAEGLVPFGGMVIYLSDASFPSNAAPARGDVVAAFVGGECRGVVAPEVVAGGTTDIVLTILEKESDVPGSTSLQIRHYSTLAHGYYESVPIAFSSYQVLGRIDSPYVPMWK